MNRTPLYFLALLLWLLPSPAVAQSFGPAQGFPFDPVISAQWFNGKLYLGTQGSGIYEWYGDRIVPSQTFKSLSREVIYGFSIQSDSLVPDLEPKPLATYPIVIENENHTKFIITERLLEVRFGDQLVLLDPNPSRIWKFSNLIQPQLPTRLIALRTGSTLQLLDSLGTVYSETIQRGLIFDLALTKRGFLLSTEGGLFRWTGRWTPVTTTLPIFEFEPANLVRTPLGLYPLTEVLDGNWMNTSPKPLSGLTHQNFDLLEGEEVYGVDTIGHSYYHFTPSGVKVRNDRGPVLTLDVRRGLPILKPGQYGVAAVDSNLLIATPQGLWSARNFAQPNTPSGHLIFYKNGLRLTGLENSILEPESFGFQWELDYSGASPIYARYSINQASYTSFDPYEAVLIPKPASGKYQISIELSSYEHFQPAISQQFTFRILPPWYKRPWILALIVAVVAGLALWRARQVNLKMAAQLELEERLANAELASKRLQMNPHFLFNALDAISGFIMNGQKRDAILFMGKLAKLLRFTLDSARTTSMILADERDLIEQYIALSKLRYGEFDTEIVVQESVDLYDISVPPMLLQPLVENAVQHAIRPNLTQSLRAQLHIAFYQREDTIQIAVTDNGPGFNAKEAFNTSHGLNIIQERLLLLSKKSGAPHTLLIESPLSSNPTHGSKVTLVLPLH